MLGVPKNGTTTHVVVPSQHKHKIKHDKTTVQSACLYQRGISTALVYSHTREQLQVDHIKLNKSTLICSSYQMIKQKNAMMR